MKMMRFEHLKKPTTRSLLCALVVLFISASCASDAAFYTDEEIAEKSPAISNPFSDGQDMNANYNQNGIVLRTK